MTKAGGGGGGGGSRMCLAWSRSWGAEGEARKPWFRVFVVRVSVIFDSVVFEMCGGDLPVPRDPGGNR